MPNKPVEAGAKIHVEQIVEPVRQAGERIEQTLQDPRLLERIPGRSVSVIALALLAVALLSERLPRVYGVGLWWTLFLLVTGFAVLCHELRGTASPLGKLTLPKILWNPLLPPVFAAIVVVMAFQLFSFSLLSLLWTVAAGLLVWDQWRKTVLSPAGFGQSFDFAGLMRGYRGNVFVGVLVCLAALFLVWGKTAPRVSTMFNGGMRYSLQYDAVSNLYGYGMRYDPLLYLNMTQFPGYEFTGRNLSFVVWAEIALLSLVIWAAHRTAATTRTTVGVMLFAGVALWWITRLANYPGVWLFFAGLVLIGSGVYFLFRGQETGRFVLFGRRDPVTL